MPRILIEEDLNQLLRSARMGAVVLSWAENGFFRALLDGPKNLADLEGDLRALETTAPILVQLGLLEMDGPCAMLASSTRSFLESGVFAQSSASGFLGELSRLPDVLREGGPVRDSSGVKRNTEIGVRVQEPDSVRSFMDMLDRNSVDSAQFTAQVIHRRVPPGGAVLDLGGGHGRYGRELADLGHSAALFDMPPCIAYARDKHADKLTYLEGDFFHDDLGGPYDAILLSNIVHGLGPEKNAALLRRARKALSPGGYIVLKDMFIDSTGCSPDRAVVFGLTMLMYTEHGRSYTFDEMETISASSGLMIDGTEFSSVGQFSLVFLRADEN
jgi:C-methyltransferase